MPRAFLIKNKVRAPGPVTPGAPGASGAPGGAPGEAPGTPTPCTREAGPGRRLNGTQENGAPTVSPPRPTKEVRGEDGPGTLEPSSREERRVAVGRLGEAVTGKCIGLGKVCECLGGFRGARPSLYSENIMF